jgi:cation:H+ antiporter
MAEIFIWSAIFIFSLIVLVKSSDYFTEAAERIGIYFRLPAFIIGVTIVAFGTSLPELVSSIISVINGSSEIVIGNVIGSNITNIFLIAGVGAILLRKINIGYELLHIDLPILIGSAFFLAAAIWDGVFSFGEAIIALIGLVIYLAYTLYTEKTPKDKEIVKEAKKEIKQKKLTGMTWVILVLSIIALYFGADFTVRSIINLSEILNVGKEIIAVTVVALGTSLPELMVTISAVRMKNPEIVVGNILGSNIFNTFAVMGIPALFGTLIIPSTMITLGLPLMLIATLLFFFMTQEKELTNWEGLILILFYVFFIGKLFNLI